MPSGPVYFWCIFDCLLDGSMRSMKLARLVELGSHDHKFDCSLVEQPDIG